MFISCFPYSAGITNIPLRRPFGKPIVAIRNLQYYPQRSVFVSLFELRPAVVLLAQGGELLPPAHPRNEQCNKRRTACGGPTRHGSLCSWKFYWCPIHTRGFHKPTRMLHSFEVLKKNIRQPQYCGEMPRHALF